MNNFTKQEYINYGIQCNTRFESNNLQTRVIDRTNNKNQKAWAEFENYYDLIKNKEDASFYIDVVNSSLINDTKCNYNFEPLKLALYTLFTNPSKQMAELLHIDNAQGTLYNKSAKIRKRDKNMKLAMLMQLKPLVMVD